MAEFTGRGGPPGRVGILVSRYNEVVTAKLLAGALEGCRQAGVADDDVDVVWAPGAFELPGLAAVAAATGRYACLVALGAVIRGETPHFEFVAGAAAHGLSEVAVRHGIPVTFGVLTVDTMEQAAARAGGAGGNKGFEAAEAALQAARAGAALRARHAEG